MSLTLEYSDPLMFKANETPSSTISSSVFGSKIQDIIQIQNMISISSRPSTPINALDDPQNVWKKRNLENAMTPPPQEPLPKSNLLPFKFTLVIHL